MSTLLCLLSVAMILVSIISIQFYPFKFYKTDNPSSLLKKDSTRVVPSSTDADGASISPHSKETSEDSLAVPSAQSSDSNPYIVENIASDSVESSQVNDQEETCDSSWIDFNLKGFKEALSSKVYGQPLVGLANAIQHHWNDKKPRKALVLSLHGPTGTGKNYIARILADYTFKKGKESRFYHLLHAAVHFPHKNQLPAYVSQIQQLVSSSVAACPKSIFVLDEFDKMPHSLELLDAIKPFLDFHDNIGGIDYRRAIFMFLRNDGSDVIMKHMVQQKRLGHHRYKVYKDFDKLLSDHLKFRPTGAPLYHSLVSLFVPLLPLERAHVAGCIDDFLLRLQPDSNEFPVPSCFFDRVLSNLTFLPPGELFFAESGCKRVEEKTRDLLEEEQFLRSKEREQRRTEKFRL